MLGEVGKSCIYLFCLPLALVLRNPHPNYVIHCACKNIIYDYGFFWSLSRSSLLIVMFNHSSTKHHRIWFQNLECHFLVI